MAIDPIGLEREELKLELNPGAGTITVRRRDGAISFGPLLCRARFRSAGGRAFDPISTLVPGWKAEAVEIETPIGRAPGLRAILDAAPGLPVALYWEIALIGEADALFRLSLENRDPHAITLTELVPVGYRGADPGLDLGAGYLGWRFFRLGYQSWSPAGSIGVMDRDWAPRFFLPSRGSMNPRAPYSRRPGLKVSDWMAQVADPKLGLSALLGFITSADQNGRVEFEVKYDRFRRLEAVADQEDRVVDAGATAASEWVLLSLDRDPQAQQRRYLDRWGQAMKARLSPPQTGWCSWYFAFWKVSEKIVAENLAALEDWNGLLDWVQLDDGFQAAVGDWLQWNKKFPSPPRRLADRIREQGRRPGIWLAPFLVSRGSRLYREHPEWLVRNRRGRPVVAFIHPAWKGRVIHALDATHPGAQQWLREQTRGLVHDFGFSYLKLDFVYAAALPGLRYDRRATGASALRRGLEIIREEAGEATYLLGCGCPLGPAVGVVDSMRVSPDVDIRYRLPLLDAISGVPTGPGAVNCFRNNLARLNLHGRLWANDPDAVVLRDAPGGMRPHELKSELTVYYLGGGAVFLSEDLPRLPPERREWLRRLLPPANKAATALDLFERGFPRVLLLRQGDCALAALFNWQDQPRELVLDLDRLGLAGPHHVLDYWAGKYLGVTAAELSLGFTPAHGVRYLRLCPADDRPRLLALEHHLGMGGEFCESAAVDGGLQVRIGLPGPRRGRVWAVFPGGQLVTATAEFRDRWEGTLHSP
jgi:alpha-galactosidase